MMMRDICPSVSRPAVLRDFRLVFRTKDGFAGAEKSPGSEIHGVLHRITEEESHILDAIEMLYTKETVGVSPYHQEEDKDTVQAVVYVFDEEQIASDPEKFEYNPPGARYMEILQEGAGKFRLDEDYVRTQLVEIQIIPRKPVHQCTRLEELSQDVDLPVWSEKEMLDSDTVDEG